MDTKALRQKILDLAIRGKLVPLEPNDEPASVLLERIRAEKQQMVKDGKLKPKDIKNDTVIFKGDDNLHYEKFSDGTVKCIEDEIPFELPEGWEWTRLGCITDVIQYGLSNSAESTGDYRLLRITDIQNGCVNWDTVPFTSTDEPEKYLLHKDDIVFARTGATVGKSFLITDLPYASVYASYLIRIRLINGISANYIYHFFNSYCYWEQVTDKAVGVGQPNCNGTALRELFIPLPSQAEQNRIVPVADNLLKIVDTITSEQESLSELIQTTKSKILDLAIRGKLVPQDPNDEPASVLLERIRAEKDELIKQGKIKRDKKESVIFKGDDNSYYEKIGDDIICIDDEIPFETPINWQWVRLGSTVGIERGGSPRPIKSYITTDSNGINWIKIGDVDKDGKYITNTKEKIKPTGIKKSREVYPGDFLLTNSMSFGRPYISKIYGCIHDGWLVLRNPDVVFDINFLYYLLSSNYLYNQFVIKASGSTVDNLNIDKVSSALICLPPLKEQTMIVNQIEKIIRLIQPFEELL